jgi:hypothetical protein
MLDNRRPTLSVDAALKQCGSWIRIGGGSQAGGEVKERLELQMKEGARSTLLNPDAANSNGSLLRCLPPLIFRVAACSFGSARSSQDKRGP